MEKLNMSGTAVLAPLNNLYSRILSKFPLENLTYCFAYGSGVLKQKNNEHKKNMIDFIFAVDNAEKWHECNLIMNRSHYSFLSLFGSKAMAKIQTNIASKVYFNSMISLKDENVVIKYGVITESDLIADLLDWNDLYVAGRLHKPVEIIRKTTSEDLAAALQLNLQSAVHATLLLLPENFSEVQFYKTLSSLSYIGDFRMKFGEDKNKIDNIVMGGLEKFKNLYSPILKMMEDYVEIPTTNDMCYDGQRCCRQDISPSAKHFHLNHLPRTPQRKLVQFWNKGSRNRQDTEDVLRAMAFDQDCREVFQAILSDIVWDSSIKQSLKGILTAGIFTSVIYSSKKIGKMLSTRNLTASFLRNDNSQHIFGFPKKNVRDVFFKQPDIVQKNRHLKGRILITCKKSKMNSEEEVTHEQHEKSTFESSDLDAQSSQLDNSFFGPVLPPHLLIKDSANHTTVQSRGKIYGPILPEYLNETTEESSEITSTNVLDTKGIIIGPALPEGFNCNQSASKEEEDFDDSFGPSADLMASGDVTSSYKFMNVQSSSKKVPEDSPIKRETWMIELPEKKRANFGLQPRHFKSQIPLDKEGDDSVWTETPADKAKKHTSQKDHNEILKIKRLQERDKQMEKLAKKAAKKLKKEKSLLEIHQKIRKKKKEKEAKKLQEKGKTVPERRPFDRNIDLQIRKIDENKRIAILNKSQFLNNRFAPGQSKFL